MNTPDQTNINYGKVDGFEWAANPLILGYKIQLSKTNSTKVKILRCDLCIALAGEYPTTFNWTGWHEACICFKTPILMPREYLNKLNRIIAQGADTPQEVHSLRIEAGLTTKLPESFKEWVLMNIRSEEQFNNAPDWVKENFENFNELKQKL